jgi:hypothetical protein
MLKGLFSRGAAPAAAAPIAVVCATRASQEAFWSSTRLGQSLPSSMTVSGGRVAAHVAYCNGAGLPDVYNTALDALPAHALAVLVHDDVDLYDYQLATRVDEALARFDVAGVAGNALPEPDHVGWYYRRPAGGALEAHAADRLSGAVDHLHESGEHFLSMFGPAPRAVELLDGLLLAVRVARLRERGVRFDAQFRFHFYDLDFCRQCARAGLSMGTWPLAVGHAGMGRFETPEWEEALTRYRAKWGPR